MQVKTISAQLGLGPELADWYRDATSVPDGHLLIYLSPRTDDRLRYCTITGSIVSKFYIPDRLKHLKSLDDEHAKSFNSPSVPIVFPQTQKSFPSLLRKRFYQLSLRMHSKSAQRKPAKHEKTSPDNISQRSSIALSDKNNLEAKKRSCDIQKRFTAHKSFYSSRL